MKHVAVVVEGQTEAAFVETVLAPYLVHRGTYVTPVIVTTSRSPGGAKARGGGSWKGYSRDTRGLLAAPNFHLVSVLIDFYGYPSDGPGHCAPPHRPYDCARAREAAMVAEFGSVRFVPHVVLHEFETWVIAAAMGQSSVLGSAVHAVELQKIAARVSGEVELINDSPATAPSKRVLAAIPGYSKSIDGVSILDAVGLEAVMRSVPRLRAWVDRLVV